MAATAVAPNRPVVPNKPVVPNRPVAPPQAGKANIPAPAAAPVPETVAAPVASAAPVAENAAGAPPAAAPKKRGRKAGAAKVEKTDYPGLLAVDESGNAVMIDDGAGGQVQQRNKLTAVPTDYDAKKYAKLKSSDFADEAVYMDFRAAEAQRLVTLFSNRARKLRTLGSVADRARANKLIKMRENMAKLAAQLKAEGVDVDALTADENEAPAETTESAQ